MCVLAGNRKSTFYAIAASLFLIAGCQAAESEKQMVEFKKNPAPKKAYQITMRIENAPGPFEVIEGSVSYDIVNKECLPPADSISGVQTTRDRESVPVQYQKSGDGTYTGMLYADQMLDDDYFGRGACRWRLGSASVTLKASGRAGETSFIPALVSEQIVGQQSMTALFRKASYPVDADVADLKSYGQKIVGSTSQSEAKEDFFAITLTSKEAAP